MTAHTVAGSLHRDLLEIRNRIAGLTTRACDEIAISNLHRQRLLRKSRISHEALPIFSVGLDVDVLPARSSITARIPPSTFAIFR